MSDDRLFFIVLAITLLTMILVGYLENPHL